MVGTYALSVLDIVDDQRTVQHYYIRSTDDGGVYVSAEHTFNSLKELVQFHSGMTRSIHRHQRQSSTSCSAFRGRRQARPRNKPGAPEWRIVFIYEQVCITYDGWNMKVLVFTARCYASAVLTIAMGLCPSVPLCLCPSVTSRCSTKTAKRRITQTTPHDTPGTSFWCQRCPRNSTGVTPYGAPNAGVKGQNRQLSTNNRLYLENGTR